MKSGVLEDSAQLLAESAQRPDCFLSYLCTQKSKVYKCMMPTYDKKTPIQREADRYTREQMRLLLCVHDMVKEEVKREVSKQLEQLKK